MQRTGSFVTPGWSCHMAEMTFTDMSTFILKMVLSDNGAYAASVLPETIDTTTIECRYYRRVFEIVKRDRTARVCLTICPSEILKCNMQIQGWRRSLTMGTRWLERVELGEFISLVHARIVQDEFCLKRKYGAKFKFSLLGIGLEMVLVAIRKPVGIVRNARNFYCIC